MKMNSPPIWLYEWTVRVIELHLHDFSVASLIEWQQVVGQVSAGYDYVSVPGKTLLECQEMCLADQPRCRSIEFFPVNDNTCKLDDVAFGDAGFTKWFGDPGGTYYSFCELGRSHKTR